MVTKTQEQFLNDTKAQIAQFVYRSSEESASSLIKGLQEISGNGALNWHVDENKEKLASVFTSLAAAVNDYTLSDGDFRSYLVLKLVIAACNTYEQELFKQYLQQGYNVLPESVVGSISDAYSTQLPQNTNFPGTSNTANKFIPEKPATRLVPDSLYSNRDY